ncbi:MAG: DUF1570 domain-containing protein [Planctomycetes bacterium]|nr:DUF1570 domain-containing protein [Planctomycetota bacterium]
MLLLFLAALSLQDAKQRYNEKIQEMNQLFWTERLKIADWAKEAGLYREAREHYEFMVKNIPGSHPYKARASNQLVGPWKKQPNKAAEAKQKEYAKRLDAYYRSVADRCFEAYRIAKSGGLAEEARTCLGKTVEFYLAHPAARKERGEERVEGFGWVPKADADLSRAAVPAGPPDELEKDDAKHETWGTAWVVRSKHYLLRTDLPIRRAVAVLELLEKLYDALVAWCEGTFTEPAPPLGVYFFRKTRDLEAERARLPGARSTVAFYHQFTGVVYVRSFDSAAEQGDGVGRSDQEFLLHECAHQFFDLAAGARIVSTFQQADQRADAPDNFWIMEGIAGYFSTLRFENGEAKLGGDTWRLPEVRKLLSSGRLPGLRAFLTLNGDEFLARSAENYAIAYAFAAYLAETRKKPFVAFLKEYYLGSGSVDAFEKAVGKTEKLEPEFRGWLEGR